MFQYLTAEEKIGLLELMKKYRGQPFRVAFKGNCICPKCELDKPHPFHYGPKIPDPHFSNLTKAIELVVKSLEVQL
jgi:hypothetical protein